MDDITRVAMTNLTEMMSAHGTIYPNILHTVQPAKHANGVKYPGNGRATLQKSDVTQTDVVTCWYKCV